jgi:hypothetical protein
VTETWGGGSRQKIRVGLKSLKLDRTLGIGLRGTSVYRITLELRSPISWFLSITITSTESYLSLSSLDLVNSQLTHGNLQDQNVLMTLVSLHRELGRSQSLYHPVSSITITYEEILLYTILKIHKAQKGHPRMYCCGKTSLLHLRPGHTNSTSQVD